VIRDEVRVNLRSARGSYAPGKEEILERDRYAVQRSTIRAAVQFAVGALRLIHCLFGSYREKGAQIGVMPVDSRNGRGGQLNRRYLARAKRFRGFADRHSSSMWNSNAGSVSGVRSLISGRNVSSNVASGSAIRSSSRADRSSPLAFAMFTQSLITFYDSGSLAVSLVQFTSRGRPLHWAPARPPMAPAKLQIRIIAERRKIEYSCSSFDSRNGAMARLRYFIASRISPTPTAAGTTRAAGTLRFGRIQ